MVIVLGPIPFCISHPITHERRDLKMGFDVGKVGSAMWPEAGGVALFILAKLGTRYIDETYALTGVFRRTSDYVEAAGGLIPAYLIATGSKATDEAKAVLYTEIGFMGQRLGDWAYGETIGKKAKVAKNRRLATKQNKGTDVLSQAEKILIAESRAREVNNPAALAKTPAGVGSYTEI